ncbi:MAG TPA: branched-chain amino acid ABC transporter permease [bacterium]|nr:branched-chain amino acid ABC transporter permease [bacterium]
MTQVLSNMLYSACTICLVGISFSFIFSAAKFFHFAHAGLIASGAYAYLVFSQWCSLPVYVSVPLALAASAGLGLSLDLAIYRPMRNCGASPLILLLASLGLYILLQNGISMVFGDDTKVISNSDVTPAFLIFGARVTGVQLTVMAVAIAVLFIKVFFLDRTKNGLALRAVADSPELARLSGINFDKTMGIAFCLGSFLASTIGLLQAFDVGMTPTMGLPTLLLGVVAVVIGGDGKILGVAVASLFLAFVQHVAGWQFGAQWQETTAFLLLLAFLLCRPQGVFGKRLAKTSV